MRATAPACDVDRGCFGTNLFPGIVVGGLVGAVAMLVVGAPLAAAGLDVNPYGDRLLATAVGLAPWWLQLVQHLALSVAFAAPLVWALRWCRGRPRVGGGVYGALLYAGLHAAVLPSLFGESATSGWPVLVLHVVFGVAVVVGVERIASRLT